MLKRILLVILLTIASAVIASAQTATLKNYYNQENKVGFKYPASWASGKSKWDVGTKTAWMEGEEPGFTVLMDLSKPALNLGYLSQAEVALTMATIDEASCKEMNIGNINKVKDKPVVKKVGTRTFFNLEAEDGAAGSAGTTDYYRTFHDGRCYELAFLKFGRNTPKRPDAKEKALDRQFNAILHSLYFGK
jgi:hypothetical protein